MNPNDRNNPTDPGDEALDRLLARARWEEPNAADEYRLAEQWMELRPKRRIGATMFFAAAAAIAIVVGTIALLRPEPVDVVITPEISPVKLMVTHGNDEPPPDVPSRDATMYERLLVMQGMHARPAEPKAPPSPLDSTVQRLVQQLGDPLVEKRFEAAQALASLNNPRVTSVLTEMVSRNEHRREALAALMWSSDPTAARALAALERNSRTIDAQMLALKVEFGDGSQRRIPWSVLDTWLRFSV